MIKRCTSNIELAIGIAAQDSLEKIGGRHPVIAARERQQHRDFVEEIKKTARSIKALDRIATQRTKTRSQGVDWRNPGWRNRLEELNARGLLSMGSRSLAYVQLAKLEMALKDFSESVEAWLAGGATPKGPTATAQAGIEDALRVFAVFQKLLFFRGMETRKPTSEEALVTAIACGWDPVPPAEEDYVKAREKWKRRLSRLRDRGVPAS